MTLLTPDRQLRQPDPARRRRPTAVLLVGAPLVMVAGRVLLVPYDHQDWNGMLDAMAAHRGRSDTGWLLAVAASGLLGLTATLLARRLHDIGWHRTAGFGAITTALGWAGCAGIATTALLVSGLAGSPDRPGQVNAMSEFNNGSSNIVYVMCLAGAVGYLVLSYGLGRSGSVSSGAAILIGLGGATTLLTMPGPVSPFLVLASLLLTAGHVLALQPGRALPSTAAGTPA